MFTRIPDFLEADQLESLRQELAKMPWEDGSRTAAAAKSRKNNEQLTQATPQAHPLLQQMYQRVLQHPAIGAWAAPKRITKLMFARYGAGMFYGSHNDAAIAWGQQPTRSDISFTVFLNGPEAYEGGKLVIESPLGEVDVKEPAGSIVLYDTGLRHRVEEITSGTRLVVVGWMESLIRSPVARDVLNDVSSLIMQEKADPDGERVVTLRRIRGSLLRMWAET